MPAFSFLLLLSPNFLESSAQKTRDLSQAAKANLRFDHNIEKGRRWFQAVRIRGCAPACSADRHFIMVLISFRQLILRQGSSMIAVLR